MGLPQFTDILIVGAGPTGLACALALVEQGHTDFTIVDSVLAGENPSRALVIHAATLEALDDVGCAVPLVKAGNPGTSLSFWSAGHHMRIASFDLLSSYTKFPMGLIIPQTVTEQVLIDKLRGHGINVLRPYKVVDLKKNKENARVTNVFFESGEIVQARCIIGADGAKSTVRRITGVDFPEPDGEDPNDSSNNRTQMVIADVTFSRPPALQDNGVLLILSPDNTFMIAPLPRASAPADSGEPEPEQVYRVAVGIPQSLGAPPPRPSTEYIQFLSDAWGPGRMEPSTSSQSASIKVTKTIWSTCFQTHSAIADTFLTHLPAVAPTNQRDSTVDDSPDGPIILLGDAAHIHPPAGGQGMNLGIRDALALGPALSAFLTNVRAVTTFSSSMPFGPLSGLDVERPLRTWAAARREHALTVLRLVKLLLWVMSLPDKWEWIRGVIPVNRFRLRNVAIGVLTRLRWVRRRVALRVSGLAFKE